MKHCSCFVHNALPHGDEHQIYCNVCTTVSHNGVEDERENAVAVHISVCAAGGGARYTHAPCMRHTVLLP